VRNILVTGGAGFIGSHTTIELLEAGNEVAILDNFSNSDPSAIERIERSCGVRPEVVEGDVRDEGLLARMFSRQRFAAVIHFAGLKAVGESVENPLLYYDNNVYGSLVLLRAMAKAGIKTFVFSSSATVYGAPASVPIDESFPRSPESPYGRSKLIVEDILHDLHGSDPNWRIARLRYFNPVGAHKSGLIGEDPRGVPNNLMPLICQVAAGLRKELHIYGDDYATPDGTGIRDYIHVMDLAQGHIAALDYLEAKGGLLTVNLGTGRGCSVLELITSFEKASARKIDRKVVARRAGDIAEYWACPDKAERLLSWKARRTIDDMCADAWRWQMNSMG
jgi:UDP-glucose 4-epimerase